MVEQDQRGHRLHHRHRTWQHARIVTAATAQRRVPVLHVHGVLLVHDRGHRLERDAEMDRRAVRDAPLDPAGTVRRRHDLAVHVAERVVVLQAREQHALEARAHLETLRRRQRQHRLRQVGLEPVEHRVAPADRDVAGDAQHDAADAVALAAPLLDQLDHRRRGRRVRTAEDVRLHLLRRECVRVDRRLQVLHLSHAREHFHAPAGLEDLLRQRAGGDPSDGLPRARASAPGPRPMPVLRVVGVVGMARTELLRHLVVGLRAEVLVLHPHRDRRARGQSLERARQDLHRVRLLARRGDRRLAGATAVEIRLDVRLRERHARRAAVDDDADAAPVGFAPGGDAEQVTKRVAHGRAGRCGRAPDGESGKGVSLSRNDSDEAKTDLTPTRGEPTLTYLGVLLKRTDLSSSSCRRSRGSARGGAEATERRPTISKVFLGSGSHSSAFSAPPRDDPVCIVGTGPCRPVGSGIR